MSLSCLSTKPRLCWVACRLVDRQASATWRCSDLQESSSGRRMAAESEEMTSGSPPNLPSVGSLLGNGPLTSSPGPDSADASPYRPQASTTNTVGFLFPFREASWAPEVTINPSICGLGIDAHRWVVAQVRPQSPCHRQLCLWDYSQAPYILFLLYVRALHPLSPNLSIVHGKFIIPIVEVKTPTFREVVTCPRSHY